MLNLLIDDIVDKQIGSLCEFYLYLATLKLMYQSELNDSFKEENLGDQIFRLFCPDS